MDTTRFHGKRGAQRFFNKSKSRYNQSQQRRETRPYSHDFKLGHPEQAKEITGTYTTDPVEGEAWLRNNVINVRETALGFDMEWKPQFIKKKDGGKEHPTAVLQLSTETSCLVLHIIHINTFPRYLVDILEDQNIHKVGCGIRSDITKLLRDTGLRCKGAVDLVHLASKIGCTKEQGLGLKSLSRNLLGIELDKPKRVQLSNWEQFPLTRNQIHYAALDAWVGIKLFLHMKRSLGDRKVDVEPEATSLPARVGDPKKVVCNVCGKKCKSEEELQNHLARAGHTACVTCGQMFVRHVSKKHLKRCGTVEAPPL